jgi:hypothetical protein
LSKVGCAGNNCGTVWKIFSLGDLKAVLTSQSKGNTVKVAIAIKRIN